MKNLLIVFILSLGCAFGVQAQSALSLATTPTPKAESLSWNATSHNFGDIQHQQPKTVSFTFTNNSDKPVVITEAKGSCGCTVASYTQDPIAPNENGTVKATYNAAKLGTFSKTVAVKTTASEEWQQLKITGIVVE
ncbi:MAG: DUF1573 domain-containing protein [Tunicatimonas sp.]|uniref:DUF1573 domain-containing protein n=1 Tax=Tunicatimonas sp. TaxID=1940096 RepID=UPI003C720F8F